MILSIGEILADVVMDADTGEMRAHIGGAPFNVAVGAARCGASAVFCGRIGNDPLGRFIEKESRRFPIETVLQRDGIRPTTIAFVSISDGERDFKFTRSDAADFHIELDEALFERVKPTTVHLGSLMLSERVGVETARKVASAARKYHAALSFDVNYREDVFVSRDAAAAAYAPFIEAADIVKFSEEELYIIYGEGLSVLPKLKNPVACVTLGKDGCAVKLGDRIIRVPSEPVKPIDTTGAGDAFFGAFLAHIDGKLTELDEGSVIEAARAANAKGAEATQFEGAVKP